MRIFTVALALACAIFGRGVRTLLGDSLHDRRDIALMDRRDVTLMHETTPIDGASDHLLLFAMNLLRHTPALSSCTLAFIRPVSVASSTRLSQTSMSDSKQADDLAKMLFSSVPLSSQFGNRRSILHAVAIGGFANTPAITLARAPGSNDISEAVMQIVDGRAALQQLRKDWANYACIDKEGRACNIDVARKIFGGVAPQRGDAAIEVAKVTPLYRIDGAFAAVRKFALDADANSWGSQLDIETFVELGEDITFRLKKADDSFYSVVFAAKGSTMLENLYAEAREAVDKTLSDFNTILGLLQEAGCPYVIVH